MCCSFMSQSCKELHAGKWIRLSTSCFLTSYKPIDSKNVKMSIHRCHFCFGNDFVFFFSQSNYLLSLTEVPDWVFLLLSEVVTLCYLLWWNFFSQRKLHMKKFSKQKGSFFLMSIMSVVRGYRTDHFYLYCFSVKKANIVTEIFHNFLLSAN